MEVLITISDDLLSEWLEFATVEGDSLHRSDDDLIQTESGKTIGRLEIYGDGITGIYLFVRESLCQNMKDVI